VLVDQPPRLGEGGAVEEEAGAVEVGEPPIDKPAQIARSMLRSSRIPRTSSTMSWSVKSAATILMA